MKWFGNEKGFTFLEMTIVIAIIGFLMMIGLPNYKIAAENAQKKSCEVNRKLIESQIESYYLDEHLYPLEDTENVTDQQIIAELINKKYLKSEPKCPSGGTYEITLPSESSDLTVICTEHPAPPPPSTP